MKLMKGQDIHQHDESCSGRHGSRLQDGTAHQVDHRQWTRRDFLVQMGLAAAATPIAFGGQRVRAMHQAPLLRTLQATDTNRVLVIIQLGGGNDGLNTIVPVRNDIYYRARPRIAVPSNQAIPLDDEAGMHPALQPLEPLWGEGQLAVVRNVGYGDSTRSHFDESARWVTGSGSDSESTGWAGRYLDETLGNADPSFPPFARKRAAAWGGRFARPRGG